MTKEQKYKFLFENWRSFLKEEDKKSPKEDEDEVNFRSQVDLTDPMEKGSSWDALSNFVTDTGKMIAQKYIPGFGSSDEPKDTPAADSKPQNPTQKSVSKSSASSSAPNNDHVSVVRQELEKFKDETTGKQIKEKDRRTWEHIAKYWRNIRREDLATGTEAGKYKIRGKGRWADRAKWSAAFIQYCMRGNNEFKKLQYKYGKHAGAANHKWYWMAARENTKSLKNGTLPENDWFFLTAKQMSEIGYSPQVGDIGMSPNMHGDIFISPEYKVGGNVSDSVRRAYTKTVAVVTQNTEAKEKFLKFHDAKVQNTA